MWILLLQNKCSNTIPKCKIPKLLINCVKDAYTELERRILCVQLSKYNKCEWQLLDTNIIIFFIAGGRMEWGGAHQHHWSREVQEEVNRGQENRARTGNRISVWTKQGHKSLFFFYILFYYIDKYKQIQMIKSHIPLSKL